MSIKELELRQNAKNAITELVENTKDKYCYGCMSFRYHRIRAGAPENMPHAECQAVGMYWTCGMSPTKVQRLTDCIVGNFKIDGLR
jgi:hypothetical protein